MADVTIYTTPTCPYCKQTKEFFNEHDIDFQEFNVADDRDKAKEMIQKSGQKGVPVTIIEQGEDEEIIVGFNQDRLASALGIEA